MKPFVLGAAAISATTATAATTIVISLGSCTDASKQTPFELSTGVTTPLPSNGSPFCSVKINSVSLDLVRDTAQCFVFGANAQTPINVASFLGGPYTGNTPLTSIICSANNADEPSSSSGTQPSDPLISNGPRLPHAARQEVGTPEEPTTKPQKREALPHPTSDTFWAQIPDKRHDNQNKRENTPNTSLPPMESQKPKREAAPEPSDSPFSPIGGPGKEKRQEIQTANDPISYGKRGVNVGEDK